MEKIISQQKLCDVYHWSNNDLLGHGYSWNDGKKEAERHIMKACVEITEWRIDFLTRVKKFIWAMWNLKLQASIFISMKQASGRETGRKWGLSHIVSLNMNPLHFRARKIELGQWKKNEAAGECSIIISQENRDSQGGGQNQKILGGGKERKGGKAG